MNFHIIKNKLAERRYPQNLKSFSVTALQNIENEFKKDVFVALKLLEIAENGEIIYKHYKAEELYSLAKEFALNNIKESSYLWGNIWKNMRAMKSLME